MARDDDTTTTPDTRSGNWSELEHSQFEKGMIAKGWGNWSSMAGCIIPTRDQNQIKTHAHKFRRSHPKKVEGLLREHEEHTAMVMCVVAAEGGGNGKPKRSSKKSSSSPPHRRASKIKAKTPALARSNSPRQNRPSSAPGRKKNTMMPSSPPPAAAAPSLSSPPSPPGSILLGGISDVYRPTLGDNAPSTSAQLLEILSPTTTLRRSPHLSVENEDIASSGDFLNKDDELAVLASGITFSSDRSFTSLDELGNDEFGDSPLFASRNDEISDTSNADTSIDSFPFTFQNGASLGGNDDAVIDPVLGMEFEERDLGMVFDFIGISSVNTIVLDTNEPNNLAMSHCIDLARPDPHISRHIRSMLIAPTDYNNPTEYFLAADGVSRTGLHRGAICRARIKELVGEHFDSAWWKDDGFADQVPTSDSNVGLTRSANGAYCTRVVREGEEGMSKTFPLEIFVALAVAMLDENDWCTPMKGDPSALAKDVEDIRYVGNLLHSLWKRVNPPHRRDGALQHDDDNLAAAAERYAAISPIVERLKLLAASKICILLNSSH